MARLSLDCDRRRIRESGSAGGCSAIPARTAAQWLTDGTGTRSAIHADRRPSLETSARGRHTGNAFRRKEAPVTEIDKRAVRYRNFSIIHSPGTPHPRLNDSFVIVRYRDGEEILWSMSAPQAKSFSEPKIRRCSQPERAERCGSTRTCRRRTLVVPNGIQRVAAMPALRERSGQICNEP